MASHTPSHAASSRRTAKSYVGLRKPTKRSVRKTSPETAVERWAKAFTTVIAPGTILVALLYYFGYTRTSALYSYFGLDVGTLNLSSQDYLLRSIDALYVPIGCLLLVALTFLWIRSLVLHAIQTHRYNSAIRIAALVSMVAGVGTFFMGVIGVVRPDVSWDPLTPVFLGVGTLLAGFSLSIRRALEATPRFLGHLPYTASVIVMFAIVVLSLFWVVSEYAQAYGRGRAETLTRQLGERPRVIIDTKDRIFPDAPGIQETALSENTIYRFRYRGFRLLSESNNRLFLIPEEWTPNQGAILVLPDNNEVRTQYLSP